LGCSRDTWKVGMHLSGDSMKQLHSAESQTFLTWRVLSIQSSAFKQVYQYFEPTVLKQQFVLLHTTLLIWRLQVSLPVTAVKFAIYLGLIIQKIVSSMYYSLHLSPVICYDKFIINSFIDNLVYTSINRSSKSTDLPKQWPNIIFHCQT